MAKNETSTSLTLTGIYSGLRLNLSGVSGLVAKGAAATARTGYRIARGQTRDGLSFDIVSVAGAENVPDPANVVVSVEYNQEEALDEVDLDVRYVDIPSGSFLQLESDSVFAFNREAISGTASVGKEGRDAGPIKTSLDLMLWVANPAALKSTSALTMSLSKVVSTGGGPVKKTLLQKIQVDLAN